MFTLKIATWQILLNTVEVKKKRNKRNSGFRKKLMILDSEFSKCLEHEVKLKTGTIFTNEKILEEYSVKIYQIDPYFCEHYKKKFKLMKMSAGTYY